jgi:ABC-type cobalt transport system substrate-binding protein
MKSILTLAVATIIVALGIVIFLARGTHEWAGVDETVVEHYAEAAGRPARDPYINTDQGDLLLFLFLIAGIAGGFAGGYCFRELFPPVKKDMP